MPNTNLITVSATGLQNDPLAAAAISCALGLTAGTHVSIVGNEVLDCQFRRRHCVDNRQTDRTRALRLSKEGCFLKTSLMWS